MSNCTNCEPCESLYSKVGCQDSYPSSCSYYDGIDLNVVNIKQVNKDTVTTSLQKLATAYEALSNSAIITPAESNEDVAKPAATDLATALELINEMKDVINSLQSKLRAANLLLD